MSLGSKLADTVERARAANVALEKMWDARAREKAERLREKDSGLIEKLRTQITHNIEDGLIPAVKVSSYEEQEKLRQWGRGNGENLDLFESFQAWAAENEIALNFREDHDGGGMSSWITVIVTPAEPSVSPEI